jgi:signal transduction histidine kinase
VTPLARLLRDHRESVSRRWLERVRAQLPSEHALDEDEIRDSLALFLDELIAALEAQEPLRDSGEAIAQSHGAQRHLLQRDITDVVREYGLLVEAVIDECRARGAGPFPLEDYGRLVGIVSRGAAQAVREFASLNALELRRQAWEHFAFLAHEVRSPLQTARMALNLLRSGASPERATDVLERSLAQLSETLDQALIDARLRGIGAGASLQLESVDVASILREALDESGPDADARNISLAIDAPGDLHVQADARLLRSAFGNLVRNAVKFTRSGGSVKVRARPRLVEIEDACGGLREGDEEKIFEAFRQSSEDRSGFGLGLAIAREGIEAHGGSIAVRNVPGHGCVFTVTLPESAR